MVSREELLHFSVCCKEMVPVVLIRTCDLCILVTRVDDVCSSSEKFEYTYFDRPLTHDFPVCHSDACWPDFIPEHPVRQRKLGNYTGAGALRSLVLTLASISMDNIWQ